jgi:tRNA pseudouridine38-40 synthase
MRYLKIVLAYDGTDYAGWQVQVGKPTVQAALEAALAKITGEEIRAVASGRTDAGVHALGQAVSFKTQSPLPCEVFCRALNGNLPRDVHVWEVREMPEGFHAIRDAVGKRYRYVIQDGPAPDLFARHYSWRIPQTLDAAAMRAASQLLLGKHDFSSFEASGSPRRNSVRTVTDIFAVRPCTPHAPGRTALPGRHHDGPEGPSCNPPSETATPCRLEIEVAADGFLYNMVRNIVGALVEVGRGAQPAEWIAQVLAARSRLVRYPTAPPRGLFLVEVYYK